MRWTEAVSGIRSRRTAHAVALLALGVGIALRVRGLDYDPVHPSWIGWALDEGRWTETARSWALFGPSTPTDGIPRLHLLLAPLWQAICTLSFVQFGVGFTAARLPSALAGSAILVGLVLGLRGRLGPWPVAACVVLAAFDPALVYFSRVAVPEISSLAFQLLGFLVLVHRPRSVTAVVVTGLCTFAALATKATTAPAAAGLLAAVVVVEPGGIRTAAIRVAAFAAGALGPTITALVGLLAVGGLREPGRLSTSISEVLGFVVLAEPFDVATTLYASGRDPVGDPSLVNLLLAAVWLLAVLSGPSVWRPKEERERVFVAALAWAAGTLGAWGLLAYFPDRWVVQVHLPLIVALSAGVAVVSARARESVPPDVAWLDASRWGLARRVAVALPAAIVAAAWIVALSGAVYGPGLDRVRWHLSIIGVLALSLGLALGRYSGRASGALACVAALVSLLVWRATAGPFLVDSFWAVSRASLLLWSTAIAAGGLAVALVVRRTGGAGADRGLPRVVYRCCLLYALALGSMWLGFHPIGRPEPTRILSDLARELEVRNPSGAEVGVERAATAMLASTLPYRDLAPGYALDADFLLVTIGDGWGRPWSDGEIDDYIVAYEVPLPRFAAGSALPAVVRIYERDPD